MFDIGFSELMVIGIVALLVLGPERLPKVARTTGHLLGRLQRYVADVKSDINREMQLEELKKLQEEARQAETITRSLDRIFGNLVMNCASCDLKVVCDEVEGMKELHFGKAAKEAKHE